MTLLREIQSAALDSTVHLPDLLRKCKVLAARLKNAEFDQWVSHELNGYPVGASLPDYRRLHPSSVGELFGPFNKRVSNFPIPLSVLPEEVLRFVAEQPVRESVSALKATLGSETGVVLVSWPTEYVAMASAVVQVGNGMELVAANMVIPESALEGILDTVRTKVLEFVLKIEDLAPDAGEAAPGAPPPVPQASVMHVYNTTITGGVANVGISGTATIGDGNAASVGAPTPDREGLKKAIENLRKEANEAPEADRDEALATVEKIEAQATSETPNVARLKQYLSLYATLLTVTSPTLTTLKQVLKSFGLDVN